MSRQVTLEIRDEQGHLQGTVPGVLSRFSPWKAFPLRGDAQEIELAYSLAVHLRSFGRRLCFYRSGPFLEHFLRWAAVAWAELPPVVDPSGGADLSAPRVVRSLDELTPGHDVVFVADTEAERTHRVVSSLPPGITVVTPGVLGTLRGWTPREAWIPEVPSIYPIVLPEVRFRAGLDLLLLDLPARAGQQPSVGFSYVHKALARTGLQFQSVDLDPIWYHRFHMRRILDTGEEPRMSNGLPLSVDAWGYNERAWNDPRKWPFLVALFRDQIDEIVTGILAARPKVLGLSVHARNEWITRHVARVIKAAAPEIVILAGGHSCYSEPFGRGAFPEHDYLVVGEADLVIGPLVEALARGERPANTPGVVCRHDDPAVPFVPGPQPHNLDALGGIALDIWPDLNFLYQTFQGARSTATPLTRGCVWSRCSFCAERFAFRSRSPANYVDELEHILQTGRGGQFSASDSDFGGDPAVLLQICEEIVRRGLKLNFGGQIRLNKNYDVDAFRLMKAAGVTSLNFGADAFTENTIRSQA